MLRELLVIALRNYDPIVAEDGAEAVALAECHQPDLILMDVMMPEMNGFKALERLKAGSLTAHIPVVLMSAGYVQAQHVERGLRLGAVDYLTKPFNIFELGARLEGWTGGGIGHGDDAGTATGSIGSGGGLDD